MAVKKENYEIVQLLLSNDKIDVNAHSIFIKNILYHFKSNHST